MTDTFRKLRINSDRMRVAFDELAEIGATGDGGVHRPSLSEAHLAARQWFREQIEKSGLEFRTDGAGNHSAILANSFALSGLALSRRGGEVEAQMQQFFSNEREIVSPSFDYAADEQRLRSGRLAMTWNTQEQP